MGSLSIPKNKRWFVDYAKFLDWLRDTYQPEFVKYYGAINHKPTKTALRKKTRAEARLYAKMAEMGYEMILKPLKYIRQKDGTFTTKGDVDVDLTVGIMEVFQNLDQIILVSGDSDYLAVVKSVHNKGRAVQIVSFRQLLSWELRTFTEANSDCGYQIIESIRSDIELK